MCGLVITFVVGGGSGDGFGSGGVVGDVVLDC